jgi:hypothetical protein
MLESIYLIVAILGSGLAGIIDLKTTDIPDWISFGMIGLGLMLHGVESILLGSVDPLVSSIIAVLFFGLFGVIMYFTGMWGGGDGALLVGIGALLPVYSGYVGWLPFTVTYLINVLIIGAFYSLAYMVILGFRCEKIRTVFCKKIYKEYIAIGGTVMAVIFLGYSISIKLNFLLTAVGMLVLLLPLIYSFTLLVEKNFYRQISSRELREGDMIGEDIPRLKIFKLEIRGLTKEQIKKIQKIKNNVIIREGIRYGPVFLLALLFTLIFGLPSFYYL